MSAKELKNRMGMIFRLGAIILLVGLMVIAALRIFHRKIVECNGEKR